MKNRHTDNRPWVYVQGLRGNAFMPTQRCCHVRHLLKEKRAVVVKQKPFTIRLLYETPEITQPLWGGSDPGRTNIGEAVEDTYGNTVYQAQVESRNREIPKLMQKRASHRSVSRQGERKARQRRATANGTARDPSEQRILSKCKESITIRVIRNTEAWFANRKCPDGWLPPTASRCVQTHLNMVDKICSILPVGDWTLEVNQFAFMRMEDDKVNGIDFQNGTLKAYDSVDAYGWEQQERKCAVCDNPIGTSITSCQGTKTDRMARGTSQDCVQTATRRSTRDRTRSSRKPLRSLERRSGPRFEQHGPSPKDYIESLPVQGRQKVVSQLSVSPSKRRYNDPARHLPGTVFYHNGHRYVKSGQQRRGTALGAVGADKAFSAKQCWIVLAGGLVYL